MKLSRIFLLCCLTLFSVNIAYAGDNDEWKFELTPYLLAASMNGTIGANGVSTDVDVSFSDILDHLDAGFMALFTAQKGKWLLGLEAVYMKLEGENSGSVMGPRGRFSANGTLELTNTLTVLQGSIGYRLLNDNTLLDIIGGLRHTELEAKATITTQFIPGLFLTGGSRSAESSRSWTDGIIALHILHPLSNSISLAGYADIGTGGSDFTYQFIAGINWQFANDFDLKIGYRHLYWDYEKDGLLWDITARGPYLGVGIQF